MINLKDQKGLTLVELLAVIVISAVLMIFVTSLYTKAFASYSEIKADNTLRYEADLLLTQLVRELYVTPEKYITYNDIEDSTNSYVTISYPSTTGTDVQNTGFVNEQVIIKGTTQTISEEVKIVWDQSSIERDTNSNSDAIYTITLTLENLKGYTRTFKSQVQSIKTKKENDET